MIQLIGIWMGRDSMKQTNLLILLPHKNLHWRLMYLSNQQEKLAGRWSIIRFHIPILMVKTFLSNSKYMNLYDKMRNELKNARVANTYAISTNKVHPSPTQGVSFSPFTIWDGVHCPTFASWIAKRNFCFVVGEMCRSELLWDSLQCNKYSII